MKISTDYFGDAAETVGSQIDIETDDGRVFRIVEDEEGGLHLTKVHGINRGRLVYDPLTIQPRIDNVIVVR